jgi:hypothetical protein
MSFVTGQALGTKLCEALGLNPLTVRHLDLRCTVGQAAEVEVVLKVPGGSVDELVTEVRKYRLIEVES